MAKKKQTTAKGNNKNKKVEQNSAWISMRTGLTIVTVMSVGMMALTGYYTIRALGWGEGLLWTVGFGVAIWLVFFGFLYFNLYIRKKKE